MQTETVKTAKLFNTGGSQAIRLPAEFRFAGSEVLIRRDERTGDVVLSPKERRTWASFVELRERLRADLAREGIENFMFQREHPADETRRDPFEDWKE